MAIGDKYQVQVLGRDGCKSFMLIVTADRYGSQDIKELLLELLHDMEQQDEDGGMFVPPVIVLRKKVIPKEHKGSNNREAKA